MSRKCLHRLLFPAALLLSVFAADAVAGPRNAGKGAGNVNVRDHRSRAVVRDHRVSPSPIKQAAPIVRDHRTQPVVRDHRTIQGSPRPAGGFVVRDHRTLPVVRDHRTPRIPLPPSVPPIKPPVRPPVIGPIRPPENPPIHPPVHPLPPIHPPVHPLPPIDPGIGNGHDGGHHYPDRPWCHARPAHCWWWYDYCRPLRVCPPDAYVNCSYSVVQCAPVVVGDVVAPASRWYLGLEGMVLPGRGLGVEAVEEGSPAALAGLRPGMVIVRCNGVALVDEASVAEAIASSGGTLRLDVLQAEGAEPATVSVAMQRVAAVKF